MRRTLMVLAAGMFAAAAAHAGALKVTVLDKDGKPVPDAVVVLAPGQEVTERDLRTFAGQQLAPFKVPEKIIFVEQIPKGATGKVQRIGMADRLGV